jgi:hypothetical protein
MLDFILFSLRFLIARISNATFIFGVLVVLIGKESSDFGSKNVINNGQLLVHPSVVLSWASMPWAWPDLNLLLSIPWRLRKRLNLLRLFIMRLAKAMRPPDKDIAMDLPLHWTKTSPSIHYNANLPLPSDGEGESCLNSPVRLITESSQLDSKDEEAHRELTGLEQVIEDIAFCFRDYKKCLSMGHLAVNCTRQIRCRNCYNYGHIAKNCLNKWVPKKKQLKSSAEIGCDRSGLIGTAVSTPASESTYKQCETSTLNPTPL